MPVFLLERIPFPSLRTYTTGSVLFFSCALLYACRENKFGVFNSAADYARSSPLELPETEVGDGGTKKFESSELNDPNEDGFHSWLLELFGFKVCRLLENVWLLGICINMIYCTLILLSKLIQYIVFGELRISEHQNLKDNFWNFVFYKFIFIFGVMNVQTMSEVISWVTWFTVLGFLNLHTQLCKDRFEYLSFSPGTARWVHVKLLSLLGVIFCSCMGLLVISGFVAMQAGFTIFAFMAAECLILGIKIMYVMIRYAIHLWDLNMDGIWEKRSLYVYYSELIFQLAALIVEFAHHFHMLLYGKIFLSMASLVIFMQLRYLFHEFQRRIKRHKNYIKVVRNMEARFPMASASDLENCNDDCAICWEKMENARKLPCGHLFHHSCLRSWLEQDTSCPTCRTMLNNRSNNETNSNRPETEETPENNPPQPPGANQQTTNHFFHFDGSRYVSWLPSFSVEVTHTQLLPSRLPAAQTSVVDSMARQVHLVFPHIPLNVINDDLRITRSVDHTIDNILEGRVTIPTPSLSANSSSTLISTPSASSATLNEQHDVQTAAAVVSEDLDQVPSEENINSLQMDAPFKNGVSDLTNIPSTSAVVAPHSTPLLSSSMELSSAESFHSFRQQSLVSVSDSASSSSSSHDDFPTSTCTGGRFSKSASEREGMLQQRKNNMLENARRRYLNVPRETNREDLEGYDSITSDMRELAYQAARRRMQEQQPQNT
ncbi:E3 ubiquitin-protein ligase AMFR [Octopus bimaculoides]|uniref:RING-type domain-containing protein n=1 Tax=Octopus bimaculoides TaxID=37653 RepID=A0A0L8IB18_OCTBM|nr:E3 ubiquitin-protein ligase AMFR [Octopus bimaculoides]|eukprot:XP_014780463.1 PREDICTED: E3 ubiquitin-protein ligase AMFR-like [Octopus bimaculoides]